MALFGCSTYSPLIHCPTIQQWNEWINTYQDRGVLDVSHVIHSPAAPGAHLTLEFKEGSTVTYYSTPVI